MKTEPNEMLAYITKREWFAGLAMQGLMAKIPLHDRTGELGIHTAEIEAIHRVRLDVAESAVDYADALIAQLNKEKV